MGIAAVVFIYGVCLFTTPYVYYISLVIDVIVVYEHKSYLIYGVFH